MATPAKCQPSQAARRTKAAALRIARALETVRDHSYTWAEWSAFLCRHFPDLHTDPRPPDQPCLIIPGPDEANGKEDVLRARNDAGRGLWHPGDLDADGFELGLERYGRMVTVLRNGRIRNEGFGLLGGDGPPKPKPRIPERYSWLKGKGVPVPLGCLVITEGRAHHDRTENPESARGGDPHRRRHANARGVERGHGRAVRRR